MEHSRWEGGRARVRREGAEGNAYEYSGGVGDKTIGGETYAPFVGVCYHGERREIGTFWWSRPPLGGERALRVRGDEGTGSERHHFRVDDGHGPLLRCGVLHPTI